VPLVVARAVLDVDPGLLHLDRELVAAGERLQHAPHEGLGLAVQPHHRGVLRELQGLGAVEIVATVTRADDLGHALAVALLLQCHRCDAGREVPVLEEAGEGPGGTDAQQPRLGRGRL